MITIAAKVEGAAGILLSRLGERIGEAGKTELHSAGAASLSLAIRAHVAKYAISHHKTADTIRGGPAPYSQHLKNAAESVTSDATASQGTVEISSPGFRRAFGPLTIMPRQRKWLTIPVHALAYNQTVDSLRRAGVVIFRPGNREFLAMREKTGGARGSALRILYVLRKSTTLKHEPELLPTETEMAQAAARGVGDEIASIARKLGLIK